MANLDLQFAVDSTSKISHPFKSSAHPFSNQFKFSSPYDYCQLSSTRDYEWELGQFDLSLRATQSSGNALLAS